jgi:hypothetical protein
MLKATNLPTTKSGRYWIVRPLLACILLGIAFASISAWQSLFHQQDEVFESVDKFPTITTQVINEALQSGVRLDRKVTLSYLRSKLTIAQFQSQGVKYTVFRTIAPETCGKLGCLYVVKPQVGASKLLQLQDLPLGEKMFSASDRSGCFVATQPQSGKLKNFEICGEIH